MNDKTDMVTTLSLPNAVIEAVLHQGQVDEAPHNHYKYPARCSPIYARELIKHFSKQNETVIDPFCGGGTTLIEALLLGRSSVGFDISSLAIFLTRVRTTGISLKDVIRITTWASGLPRKREESNVPLYATDEDFSHYRKNLCPTALHFIAFVLDRASKTLTQKQSMVVRLALLATAQRLLDCKVSHPRWSHFVCEFHERIQKIAPELHQFGKVASKAQKVRPSSLYTRRRVINRSSEFCNVDGRIPSQWLPASLCVTSPPYPGVHVLYHRWQILGRRETAAPFWIADGKDGQGLSHYCLGSRHEEGLETYYEKLRMTFSALRSVLATNAKIFQLVAFNDPSWQLPAFIEAMAAAGFAEITLSNTHEAIDSNGRLWRNVPGRKWYNSGKSGSKAGREVLLIHTPAAQPSPIGESPRLTSSSSRLPSASMVGSMMGASAEQTDLTRFSILSSVPFEPS